MRIFPPYLTGPVCPSESCTLTGTILGNLIVARGLHIELTGHLVVEAGGSAIVWGRVGRGIINHGGDAGVFGSVGFGGLTR
jgi:hypothetical protein